MSVDSLTVPTFSILTATYNAAAELPALAASLAAQTFSDYEWIVADGDSKDGTTAILRGIADPRLLWFSEPDRGIYDAMNRALDRARGRYVYFIGADDRLASDDVLAKIAVAINTSGADIVCGTVDTGLRRRFVSSLGPKTLVLNSIHHQGAFYRRKLFEHFRYRIDVPVIADYEFNLLGYLRGWRLLATDIQVATCGTGGVSNTAKLTQLYEGMHRLRSPHIGITRSWLYWLVGRANVWRRRWLPSQ